MTCKPNCPEPTGPQCHCARCHQTFSGLTVFDRHQAIDYNCRPAVSCIQNPGLTLGLVRDASGVWITPEALLNNARKAARLTANRQDRERHL